MNRLINFLINPIVLAVLFAGVIIALLPPVFDKYTIDLKQKTKLDLDMDFFYNDLDNDGYSEQVDICQSAKGFSRVYVRDKNGLTVDQWNLDHNYIPMPYTSFINDINGDGKKEIFVFTYDNDSVFLNAIDPIGSGTFLFQNRFVSKVLNTNGIPDFFISVAEFGDLNGDSINELVFAINGGYSLFPRKLFAYDIKNDSLYSSVECGNTLSGIKIADLNGDGVNEIVVDTWTPRNYTDPKLDVVYTDTFAYLMVFDNELKFLFEPKEYPDLIGDIMNEVIKINDSNYLLSLHRISGTVEAKPSLQVLDYKGRILNETVLPAIVRSRPSSRKYGISNMKDNEIMVTTGIGEVFYYNHDLKLVNKKKLVDYPVFSIYKFMDLNSDGKEEIITYDSEKNMIIADENLENMVTYNFGADIIPPLSMKYNGKEPPEVFAISGKDTWLLTYSLNRLYYWHYPIYILIFILILSINLVIRKVQKAQLQKKFEIKQQITELQLMTIKNQMEPHFTFNAINSIASVIYDEDKDVAYNYLTKISKLIRTTLEDAVKVTRTLDEEIQFVTTYLELQKFRFKDKFDFYINVSNDVNIRTTVPKMVIQMYAENAVKHGIIHKKTKGDLIINISKQANYIIISIEDDGIGRAKAIEIGSRSTGRGQLIMKQYYSLYNSSAKTKIKHEIIDMKDEYGDATGTKVVIRIPVK